MTSHTVADDTKLIGKKEFPSQTINRLQWQLDAIRANQSDVASLLFWLTYKGKLAGKATADDRAREIYYGMYKHDRDGVSRQGGILTDEQIEMLNASPP